MAQVPRLLKQFGKLRPFAPIRSGSSSSAGPTRTQEDLSKYVKELETKNNGFGYGINPYDKKADVFEFHVMMFVFAGIFVGGAFIWRFKRDGQHKNWAKREAVLLIAEKDALGLPYIDRNYVDPAKLELPSEEELDGAEVII